MFTFSSTALGAASTAPWLFAADAGEPAHHLDDLDLLLAGGGEDDVELVLLLLGLGGAAPPAGDGGRDGNGGGGGDAEGLLELLHELTELEAASSP